MNEQTITDVMQMMVNTACAKDKTFTVEKNNRTLKCRYQSIVDGKEATGLTGFVLTIDGKRVLQSEAQLFLNDRS